MKRCWIKSLIALALAKMVCAPCTAAIKSEHYGVDYYRIMPRDFSLMILPIEPARDGAAAFVLVAPSDMAPVDPNNRGASSQAASRILARTLQNILDNSSLGRTADRLQNAVSVDQSIGMSDNGGPQHSFKFKVQAEKAKAELAYTGLVHANLSYRANESELRFEIREKVADATDLVVSHTDDSLGSREMVSLSFNF